MFQTIEIILLILTFLCLLLFLLGLRNLKIQRQEIQELQRLSDDLQGMANIGAWQLDVQTQKSTWTSQTYKIHDVPEKTPTSVIMGLSFFKGEDQNKINQLVKECFNGVPYRATLEFISAKGIHKWVECAGEPVFDNNNEISKLRGTIQDVTETVKLKQKAQNEFLETETLKNQLSIIMDHSPAAVYECISNKNWTMKYMSSFIETLTGYPPSDFINDQVRSYSSIIHPEDIQYVEDAVNESIKNLKSFDLNYRILTKQGEIRFVWERGSFEKTSGNLIGIIFDQTEQKSYENLLDESQTVARLGNWSFNIKTQEIIWSNQMYQLFPEKKLLGPPTFEKHKSTIHPDDQKVWMETVNECVQHGTTYKMRFRVVHPDKIIWIEALGNAAFGSDGKITSLYGTCQDVTEKVKIEESLSHQRVKTLQASKLASLGEMSAGVAHEINNPLAIISGNLQNISQIPQDPEKLMKKVAMMLKATERITKIVNGLRKFSRISDLSEYQLKSIPDIVQETLYILEPKAKYNSVKIEIDSTSSTLILCNSTELEQVIINLVNNSIDAIKKLSEQWVKIRIFEEPDAVILQVIDSGTGINHTIENKLFDPFFTTKEVGEGTGLGLSITKGILDDHKAEIHLNKEMKNTCFEIRFPKNKDVKHAI